MRETYQVPGGNLNRLQKQIEKLDKRVAGMSMSAISMKTKGIRQAALKNGVR